MIPVAKKINGRILCKFCKFKKCVLESEKIGGSRVGRALFCLSFCKKHFFFGFDFECDDLTNFFFGN